MPDVRTNGITLHYEERGAGDPLLLIMGLGADHTLWEEHARAYEPHFRCILPDNRGAGRSDKPAGPYTTAEMAADLLGLMAALGLDRTHIAGISMGGCIAQEMALQAPERVRSLTLISAWPKCDAYTARIFESFQAAIGTLPPAAFVRMLQLWIFAAEHHARRADDLARREQAALSQPHPMPVAAFLAQCEACLKHDTSTRLGLIKAPTLVTSGDRDIFTPLHFAEAFQRGIAGSELLVLPGCGHAHHWEKLAAFNEKTLAFLKSVR